MRYKQAVLPRGAKLYYVKNTTSKTTMVDVMFPCGSRCDTIPGLAHFTEHMFFTGTKTMKKEEVVSRLDKFVNTNAYTNCKEIVFTANVFTSEFKDYLDMLATIITESDFKQKMVDQEIKVVQQEIARYSDDFRRHMYYFNSYNMTKREEYKYAVTGTKKSVATIKSKDVKQFVKKYFVVENMEIFVASPLSFEKVKSLISSRLEAKLNTNKNFEHLPMFTEYTVDKSFYSIKQKDIGKCYLSINFDVNSHIKDFEKKRKLWLMVNMMNNMSDGIMNDMRIKKSLVYGCWFNQSYTDKDCALTFSTECDKENLDEVILTLNEYLKRMLKDKFTMAQLLKAKREFDYSEDVREPSAYYNLYKLRDIRIYDKVLSDKWLKTMTQKVTIDDINELFAEIFHNPKVSVSVYGGVTKNEIMSKKEFLSHFDI